MKLKSSRLFHTGLFMESMRQVRLMGLIYMLICLIFAALPVILSGSDSFYPVYAQNQAVVLYFYTFIAPLTMGYAAFGYLTRRNASDFYHSLPVTREAAFLSRAASIAAYMLITIIATVFTSYLANALMGNAQNWGHIPYLISYHFTSALLVLACTLIGLSCAGTYFSSFIVAGLVMFLPRMILVIVALLADYAAPIVYPETLSFLLDPNMNLPVAIVAQVFTGTIGNVADPTSYILYPAAHAYTFVLAVIYLAIGTVLHHNRASEMARSSAPNRILQHLYRSLIASPLFLVIGATIAADEWNADLDVIVILAVVGLLIYFLYEIITTRKLRNLLSAAAVLPIVLVVCLAIPWIGNAIGLSAMNSCPDRDRIESVSLDADARHDGTTDYLEQGLCDYEYTDDELIDILHTAWSDTLKRYENGRMISTPDNGVGLRSLKVQFNLKGGKTCTRMVWLTPEQYDNVYTLRTTDEGFRSIAAVIPSADEITSMRLSARYMPSESSDVTCEKLWETFTEEYAALSPEDKLLVNRYNDSVDYTSVEPVPIDYISTASVFDTEFGSSYYDTFNNLHVNGYRGLRVFSDSYRVTSLTPKALLLVMEFTNDCALYEDTLTGQTEDLMQLIDDIGDGEMYLNMNLRFYDPSGEFNGSTDLSRRVLAAGAENDPEYQGMWGKNSDAVPHDFVDTYTEILDILFSGSTEITDLDSPIVMIDGLAVEDYSVGYGYSTSSRFVQLDEASFARLMEIIEANDTEEK